MAYREDCFLRDCFIVGSPSPDFIIDAFLKQCYVYLPAAGSTGAVVEAQDLQTEALAGKETLQGAVAEPQDEQAEAIAGKETLQGVIAEAQDEQAEAIAGRETLTGSIVQAQDEQAEALAGSHVFNGVVVQAQDPQAEALAGNLVFQGAIVQAQARQGQFIEGEQPAAAAAAPTWGYVDSGSRKTFPKKQGRPKYVEIIRPRPIWGAIASEQGGQIENIAGAIISGGRGNGYQAKPATHAIGCLSLVAKGTQLQAEPAQERIYAAEDWPAYVAQKEIEIQNLREELELLILIA